MMSHGNYASPGGMPPPLVPTQLTEGPGYSPSRNMYSARPNQGQVRPEGLQGNTMLTDNSDNPNEYPEEHNPLIPIFRSYVRKAGIAMIVLSPILLVFRIYTLSRDWDKPPAWLARIPCVLQEDMTSTMNTLVYLERYFSFMAILPAAFMLVYCIQHLIRNKAKSDKEWKPPHTGFLFFVLCLKVLTPLVVYTLVLVRADNYVNYNALTKQLCEVSTSLLLYPPFEQSSVFFADMWSTWRTTAKDYFANTANHFFPTSDKDQNFEFQLSGIKTDASDRIKVELGGTCQVMDDPDSEVYEIFNTYLQPDEEVRAYCEKGINFYKSQDDASTLEAGGFAVSQLLKHFIQMTQFRMMSEVFCDASNAMASDKDLALVPLPCAGDCPGDLLASQIDAYWTHISTVGLGVPYSGELPPVDGRRNGPSLADAEGDDSAATRKQRQAATLRKLPQPRALAGSRPGSARRQRKVQAKKRIPHRRAEGGLTLSEACDEWDRLAEVSSGVAEAYLEGLEEAKRVVLDGAGTLQAEYAQNQRIDVPASPSLRGEVAMAKRAQELAMNGTVGSELAARGFSAGAARRMACLLSDNVVDPELQLRPLARFMCPAVVTDLQAAVLPCQRKFRAFLQEQRQQPIVQYFESVGESPAEWLAQFDEGLCQVEEANRQKAERVQLNIRDHMQGMQAPGNEFGGIFPTNITNVVLLMEYVAAEVYGPGVGDRISAALLQDFEGQNLGEAQMREVSAQLEDWKARGELIFFKVALQSDRNGSLASISAVAQYLETFVQERLAALSKSQLEAVVELFAHGSSIIIEQMDLMSSLQDAIIDGPDGLKYWREQIPTWETDPVALLNQFGVTNYQPGDDISYEDARRLVQAYVQPFQQILQSFEAISADMDQNYSILFMLISLVVDSLADVVEVNVENLFRQIEQVTAQNTASMVLAITQAANEASAKATSGASSALNKAQYIIGLYIGFQAAVAIVPHSVAVLCGVKKGLASYARSNWYCLYLLRLGLVLTRHHASLSAEADLTHHYNDALALARLQAVVVSTSQSVFILPFILVLIFLYQSFTNYHFIVTILGGYIFIIGGVFWALYNGDVTESVRAKSAFARHGPVVTLAVGFAFMLIGTMAWLYTAEDEAYKIVEYGVERLAEVGKGKMQSLPWVFDLLIGLVWNFFFSSLATTAVFARFVGWSFKDFHLVYWKKSIRSNLWKTNLWTGPSNHTQLERDEVDHQNAKEAEERKRAGEAERNEGMAAATTCSCCFGAGTAEA